TNTIVADIALDIQQGTFGSEIGDNDFTHGFDVQRTRLDFYGNLIIPNFTYRISGDFGSAVNGNTGNFAATWVYGQYNFEGSLEGAFARLGIFKAPLFYEELVAPEFQLFAERSLVNEFFSQQYSEGLMLGYEADSFRAFLAITDGLSTRGTRFDQPVALNGFGGESDIAVTARADVKLAGDWNQFDDFSSFRGSEFAARVGAAIHYESYGETNPSMRNSAAAALPRWYAAVGAQAASGGAAPIVEDGDIIAYTFDAQVEGNGWGAFAAFYGRYEEAEVSNAIASNYLDRLNIEEDTNDFGVVVQGSYFVTDQIELFARYEGLFLDEDRYGILGDAANIEENLHFATFGGAYYFVPESQALKFTTDVIVAFEETTALFITPTGGQGGNTLTGSGAASVTGLLGQTDDTEVVVRAQFQMLF
ncbi:MAG: hypothetical protein AAF235_03260, partial [Planctomycetota bacterium]